MKYLYFKAEKGNFGDDLNPWLWSQFFGESREDSDDIFLGIGTILSYDYHLIKTLKENQRKIVFGSGIRASFRNFKIDGTWDVRFVRGPLSSAALDNKKYKYITDAAYAMRLINNFNDFKDLPKKHEIGFMPYYKSMEHSNWHRICGELGFHFISPWSGENVEHTIREIASCKVLITEAMHGAIIADLLRVPWSRYVLTTPFFEGQMVSEFKWMDWLHSIELADTDSAFIQFYRNTRLTGYVNKYSFKLLYCEMLLPARIRKDILKSLSEIKVFNLSRDSVIRHIDEKIEEEIYKVKDKFVKI